MVTIPLPHTYFSNSKVCKAQQFPLDKLCVTIVKRPCTLRSIIYNDYIHVGRIYCMPVLLIFFSSLGVFKNSSCNFLRDFSCVPPFFKFVFCFLCCHFINHIRSPDITSLSGCLVQIFGSFTQLSCILILLFILR